LVSAATAIVTLLGLTHFAHAAPSSPGSAYPPTSATTTTVAPTTTTAPTTTATPSTAGPSTTPATAAPPVESTVTTPAETLVPSTAAETTEAIEIGGGFPQDTTTTTPVVLTVPANTAPLPNTGSDSLDSLRVGAVVAATGIGLIVVTRSRRRAESALA
jgi:hypothetical protein